MSKLGQWIDRVTGRAELREQVKELANKVADSSSNIVLLQQALAGKFVGYWSSDHFQESKQYKGHVYCAISTILDQIVQATVEPAELITKDHAMYEAVHSPNPDQSLALFNEMRVLNLMLTGISVTWVVENKSSGIAERYSIPTGMLAPTRDGFRVTLTAMQGVTWSEYPVKLFSILAEMIPYEECQVVRLPAPMHLGDGWSPTSAMAGWIDLADQIDNSRYNLMAKGMRPGSKITETADAELSPEDRDRFKKELRSVQSGSENAGEHLYVPRGLVMEPWALTSNDLDHVNGWSQIRDAIYGGYKVPPVAAGIMEASSHAEFYAAMLQLTELRIQPILWRLAMSDKQVFADYFDDVPEEFMYRAHRVDDPDQKKDTAKTMKEIGAFTDNEIRAVMGYPEKPGGDEIPAAREQKMQEQANAAKQQGAQTESSSGSSNPADVGTRAGAGSNGKHLSS